MKKKGVRGDLLVIKNSIKKKIQYCFYVVSINITVKGGGDSSKFS